MKHLIEEIKNVSPVSIEGEVVEVYGDVVKAKIPKASPMDLVYIISQNLKNKPIIAQVISCSNNLFSLTPLSNDAYITQGDKVKYIGEENGIYLSSNLLGTVITPLGEVIERVSPIKLKTKCTPLLSKTEASPPPPLSRKSVCSPFKTGIKAIDTLLTVGIGSRIAVLAEPGVGKSTLLAMIAKHSEADVNVIALIGERGREVKDFLNETLLTETRQKTICVVSTSDSAPSLRIKAASTAMRIAEYFRDNGLSVLLEIDSLTRLVRAYREIGLLSGELPVRKGYPPSAFSALPKLIERAGPSSKGSITSFYTVLTSSDIDEDPMGEEIISLTDGHFTLSEELARNGHFPAIDILKSLSRLQKVGGKELNNLASSLKKHLSILKEKKESLLFGVKPTEELKIAMEAEKEILEFLKQKEDEHFSFKESEKKLSEIINKYPM